ncbi:endonuclease [Yeosuana aromativorans]|uniref:Endonuclease n=1 Tax=Yeosuana aromativorans TaxID=288019 RepID=A0A8J3BSU0_9FLAO|nr:endonuclease/exonuclease/phosphatase family protein [Yeosuana aromativorans]GGK33025.1 endonuclease [Yeosuana aromativorans]
MKKLHLIDKIVFVFNTILAAVLLVSFVLPYLPPKTFSQLSVLSLSVPFLIVVNVLFFLYWLLKVKRQLVLSLLILIIGYVFYGSLYKFSSSEDSDINTDDAFKVMNYNVRLFNLYKWIPQQDVDVKIVDFIKEQAPDILSIQEYHPDSRIDLSFFKYRYDKLSGKHTKHGQVILSQFPIVNSGSVEFPNTANNAIYADVVKGNDTIRVYNIHLESLRIDTDVDKLKEEGSERLFKVAGSTFKMQQFQTELFLLHKRQCHYKMIICGDFNNTAFSYVYRKIKGDLNDTFKEAGNGFGRTYDFRFFPVRIDFIFADEAFAVNKFKTFDDHFSDHYPIMTTLSLKQ